MTRQLEHEHLHHDPSPMTGERFSRLVEAMERRDERAPKVGDELLLGDRLAEVERLGEDAGLLGGVTLGADVGDGGGVLADEDEGEAGGDAALRQLAGAFGYLGSDLRGDSAAIDDLDRHAGI